MELCCICFKQGDSMLKTGWTEIKPRWRHADLEECVGNLFESNQALARRITGLEEICNVEVLYIQSFLNHQFGEEWRDWIK